MKSNRKAYRYVGKLMSYKQVFSYELSCGTEGTKGGTAVWSGFGHGSRSTSPRQYSLIMEVLKSCPELCSSGQENGVMVDLVSVLDERIGGTFRSGG